MASLFSGGLVGTMRPCRVDLTVGPWRRRRGRRDRPMISLPWAAKLIATVPLSTKFPRSSLEESKRQSLIAVSCRWGAPSLLVTISCKHRIEEHGPSYYPAFIPPFLFSFLFALENLASCPEFIHRSIINPTLAGLQLLNRINCKKNSILGWPTNKNIQEGGMTREMTPIKVLYWAKTLQAGKSKSKSKKSRQKNTNVSNKDHLKPFIIMKGMAFLSFDHNIMHYLKLTDVGYLIKTFEWKDGWLILSL